MYKKGKSGKMPDLADNKGKADHFQNSHQPPLRGASLLKRGLTAGV